MSSETRRCTAELGEQVWDRVEETAAKALALLECESGRDPNLEISAAALVLSYLLAEARTPDDRRRALLCCIDGQCRDDVANMPRTTPKVLTYPPWEAMVRPVGVQYDATA